MNTLNKDTINGFYGMCVKRAEQGKIVPCQNEDISKIISHISKIISDNNFIYMSTDGEFIKLNKGELLK